jgi:hypothetical protein
VHVRRLLAATLACAAAVLGASFLLGSGRAQGGKVVHTCSAPDKQFLQTVRENMTQLGYWSDALLNQDVSPRVVVQQARSEADQIGATSPDDPTLTTARTMLQTMLVQYGAAIRAKFHGGDAGVHMRLSYNLANQVHYLLVGAQPALAQHGCDVSPLITS